MIWDKLKQINKFLGKILDPIFTYILSPYVLSLPIQKAFGVKFLYAKLPWPWVFAGYYAIPLAFLIFIGLFIWLYLKEGGPNEG